MLDGLRQFIADIVSPNAQQDRVFDDTGYRLAATALLIHVISLAGEPSEIEKRKIHGLLESPFGLCPGAAGATPAGAIDLLPLGRRPRAKQSIAPISPASSCVR